MPTRVKRPTKPRAPLSRERVLETAMALADRDGVESLSMRKLGQALQVEAMSLYRHVQNRDAILDGICDLVLAEIALPAATASWQQGMRERALSTHAVLLRHPWASTLLESRSSLSPARLDYSEAMIGSLRRGGFSIAAAYQAMLILDSYLYGFVLQEISWPVRAADVPAATARKQAEVSPTTYPNLTEMMSFVVTSRTQRNASACNDYMAEFELGLDLILEALERRRTLR